MNPPTIALLAAPPLVRLQNQRTPLIDPHLGVRVERRDVPFGEKGYPAKPWINAPPYVDEPANWARMRSMPSISSCPAPLALGESRRRAVGTSGGGDGDWRPSRIRRTHGATPSCAGVNVSRNSAIAPTNPPTAEKRGRVAGKTYCAARGSRWVWWNKRTFCDILSLGAQPVDWLRSAWVWAQSMSKTAPPRQRRQRRRGSGSSTRAQRRTAEAQRRTLNVNTLAAGRSEGPAQVRGPPATPSGLLAWAQPRLCALSAGHSGVE